MVEIVQDGALPQNAMLKLCSRFVSLGLPFALLIVFTNETLGAELTVQIRSPKDGAEIAQDQSYVLIGGKVAIDTRGSGYVDIFLVLDVSGSTGQYSGADFAEFSQLPNFYLYPKGTPLSCAGRNRAGPLNLRNSILAAEVIAARRMLLQLNPETTRVGVITFGDEVWLRQPLTHNFDEVRNALDIVYKKGPYGGTNMVDAIGVATEELLGRGESEKYLDSIKALFFSPMASLLYQRQTAR
jgi:hypothetical protein